VSRLPAIGAGATGSMRVSAAIFSQVASSLSSWQFSGVDRERAAGDEFQAMDIGRRMTANTSSQVQ
jgi:hypothetical protein